MRVTAGGLAGAVSLAVLLAGCGGPPMEPGPVSAVAAMETRSEEVPPRLPGMIEDALRAGEGLDAPLRRLGLDGDERAEVLRSLRDIVSVKRLAAGTGVGVWRDGGGRLGGLALRESAGSVVRVVRGPAGLTADRDVLPRETETGVMRAVVKRSVYEAIVDAGGPPELVMDFSDIFQWDLDFFADPREGDELAILYERHYQGEPGPATPAWRERPDEPGAFLGPGRILAAVYRGDRVQVEGFLFDDPVAGTGYYERDGSSLRKTFLKSPLNYRRISSGFSRARRNPVTRQVRPHHGVDYAAAAGTPVVAAADGSVMAAGWKGSLGRHVRLRHGSGRYETVYGHLSRLAAGMRPGTRVTQNQVIGYVGATGRATGPHLHYELRDGGRPINPLTMDNPSTAPVAEAARASFESTRDALSRRLESALIASTQGALGGGTRGEAEAHAPRPRYR